MAPTHAERKADTRQRLLAAAAAIFAHDGYQGAAVDAIAARASLSTGALYARFGSKAGIFAALLDQGISGWTAAYDQAVGAGADLVSGVRGAVTHWDGVLAAHAEVVQLFMEFWSAAIRDPALRPRLADSYARLRTAGAAIIEHEARRLDVVLPIPAETMAGLFVALGDGLALQRLIDPEAVPAEWFTLAMTSLLAGGGDRLGSVLP